MNALAHMIGEELATHILGVTAYLNCIDNIIEALNFDPEFREDFVAERSYSREDTVVVYALHRRELLGPDGPTYPDGPTVMFVWQHGAWL